MDAFKEIIGYNSIKEELYKIIDMFKNKELYEHTGAKLPKGVLLYGAPGLGKTMLAFAFAKECGVKQFVIRKDKAKGEKIAEIKSVFEEAKKEKTAVIIIDDIDKFCDDGKQSFAEDETFSTIQSYMEVIKNEQIIIIATANSDRRFPPSLVRSGRFDVKIAVKKPTIKEARKIIEYYLRNKKINENLNIDDITKMISYTSCADLQSILNESAISATYKRKQKIDVDDIVEAYLKTLYHSPDDEFERTEKELETAIYHEAGHAVVSEVLVEGSVGLVSVQYSGKNYGDGLTKYCEEILRNSTRTLITLGGKAAVEMFYSGICTSGTASDLIKAAALTSSSIVDLGGNGIYGLTTSENSSESLRERQETLVHGNIERYMFMTKEILIQNKDFYFEVVENLRAKKYLLNSDIKNIRKNHKIIQPSN